MRRLLLVLTLLLANIASARELVRLVAPQTTLNGGSRAEVAWDAVAPLPRDVEEWEAFLSVDGGAHYAVRITPHVDASVRRFTFTVPNVASADARILLRIGDEEHERIIALPQHFAIVADYSRVEPERAAPSEREGESALFDDEHVSEWVTGDLVTHRHRDRQTVEPIASSVDVSSAPFAPTSSKSRARRPRAVVALAPSLIDIDRAPPAPATRDTLLLTTRLNI
jgi:hypothetical protein